MGNCLSVCTKSVRESNGEEECELTVTSPAPASAQVDGDVRRVVQRELQALRDQITHSQAVLATLDVHLSDECRTPSDLAKVHRTTQTSVGTDALPKSLECVASGPGGEDWTQVTASCPAIVDTAVQTDDESSDTVSKSTAAAGEFFLPPISPLGREGCVATPEPSRTAAHIDLDIYRSCRKLSVLPEEEAAALAEEVTSGAGAVARLAPTPPCPHQAHSFESYLLPVPATVRRQLSDPTPSPEIHPVSRRSSRSTCRPLQLQPDNYFQFPEVDVNELPPKSPPCVTFQDAEDIPDGPPRITSPTYDILQNTVSQLITISSETLDDLIESDTRKKAYLTLPSNTYTPDGSTPYKTPPENSLISTPGFFTPQEVCEKIRDSSTSSSYQTPTGCLSPDILGSSYGSPVPMRSENKHFTDVPDLSNIRSHSTLFVKPLASDFDPNRTMLSILIDESRVQNNGGAVEPPLISFTSLELDVHKPPATPSLSRTPSRRRLQRSLVRISSETPLELVPVVPSPAPPDEDLAAVPRGGGGGGGGGEEVVEGALPSLSDTTLRRLGALVGELKAQNEETVNTEKDIENKFTSLMLAFKTDKLTLERRLELQRRLRDQAEQNMAAELTNLKAAVQLLSPLCTDSEKIELLDKVSEQVEALHKSTFRVSTSAEMYGAVQQENRLSKAVDIVLRHVENLKQAYDKEKSDHVETRKVLSESISSSNAVLKLQSSKRRASIATLTRAQSGPSPDSARSTTLPLEGRSLCRARLGSLPRKVSSTIVETDQEDLPQPPQQPQLLSTANPNTVSCQTQEIEESSCSGPVATQSEPENRLSPTESDDELLPSEMETTDQPPNFVSPSYQVSRPVSSDVDRPKSWVCQYQLCEGLEWAHLRYSVAVALLVAALAVFTSTFILPHTRHS